MTLDWQKHLMSFEEYIRFEKKLSTNTIAAYTDDLIRFAEFICAEFSVDCTAVLPLHIEAYLSHVYDLKLSKATQARRLTALKGFFKFLIITDKIECSPTEFIDAPKTSRKLPDVLSIEEIDSIIAAIDVSHPQGHRNRAMLEVMYSCGLRASEVVSLQLGDLFFDDGFIRVTGKGDKQRLVPISEIARRQIENYMPDRRDTVGKQSADTLFLNRNGRKLTRVMLFTILKRAAESAGISKHLSPHSFRHSFATHLLQGGANIRQVQQLLGHESITTTEIYTHLDRTQIKNTLNSHHPINKQ